MVQLTKNMTPVKRELTEEHNNNQFDEHIAYSNKRSKNQEFGMSGYPVPPAQFNPLDEPSPLGLRLRKSPSLLDLIQMRLSEGNASKTGADAKKLNKTTVASAPTDKLKASNFPASLLKIGTWEYKSRYEGDLVAKCYFAKHKLVWEVLDGGLKNKIEIQWSDIMAIKATYPDDGPGTLDVVLSRQPLFFRETNPQPRKHTLWQATSDFTGGQASLHRRHYLQCPQGLLGKHFEKLIQCDPRLNFLSQQAEVELESPYFEPRTSVFDEPNETDEYDLSREARSGIFDLHRTTSPSSSSRSELHDPTGRLTEFSREAPSPSSGNLPPSYGKMGETSFSKWYALAAPSQFGQPVEVGDFSTGQADLFDLNLLFKINNHFKRMDCARFNNFGPIFVLENHDRELWFVMGTSAIEEIRRARIAGLKGLSHWDQIKVPGINPSMSVSDLVNHVENRITEQRASGNHPLSREEQESLEILEDISRCLFNDGQYASTASDEKSVMSKVNSLCCLLQKDPTTFQDLEPKTGNENGASNFELKPIFESAGEDLCEADDSKKGTGMSRKDSVGELLLNLPRIASLPQFYYNL